jgi:hypothetical protein
MPATLLCTPLQGPLNQEIASAERDMHGRVEAVFKATPDQPQYFCG